MKRGADGDVCRHRLKFFFAPMTALTADVCPPRPGDCGRYVGLSGKWLCFSVCSLNAQNG